jgi:ATP-dependent RNA helicase RhlE
MSNFQNLKLSAKILDALTSKGYTTPTPIQLQAIPHLLEGKDLLGIAQTGTGKTAAFALPILDNLSKTAKKVSPNNVRALILTPTRELASQIADNIKLYGLDLGFRCGVIFGGVSINNQIKAAKQGFDILVATPGRLLDLINGNYLVFSQLEIFVLDEADRMLDMGFIGDVKKIITKLPKQRQNLFFSATMPKNVAVLAGSILNNPVRVEVTPESTIVKKIDQRINLVEKANKPLLLKSIIDNSDPSDLFLVFSKTKHGANRITESLEKQSIKVAAIHGNKSQSARESALEGFRQGKLKALVATDIAARGIDIVGITHVINYDIPNHPESYVHRIGRTARAGRDGIAISFCDNSEKDLLKDIEKLIKIKLPVDESQPFHGVKASGEAKSSLDARDRPKSGYKTSVKPRLANERQPSYFAENRRWKSDGKNGRDNSKPSLSFRDKNHAKTDLNGQNERFVESKFSRDKPQKPFFDKSTKPRFSNNNKEELSRIDTNNKRSYFANNRGESGVRKDFSGEKSRSNYGNQERSRSDNYRSEGTSQKPFFDKSTKPRFSNNNKEELSRIDTNNKKSYFANNRGESGVRKDFSGEKSRSNYGNQERSRSDSYRSEGRPQKPFFAKNEDRYFDSKNKQGERGGREGSRVEKSSDHKSYFSKDNSNFAQKSFGNLIDRKFANKNSKSFSKSRTKNTKNSLKPKQ